MTAWQVVSLMVGLVVVLLIIAKILRDPAYAIMRMIKGFIVGVIALLAINWIGTAIHLHIPLNPVTALIAGLLGIPGIAALLVIQIWILP
ncbi:pro-sigmaK processing inhibitor BofA [Collibacillus ludicampi]|jgi:inhibitor of the pro-sigma K processing machinery|uniref:Pro-sigmaK processing inhibitor BofA n=1 Tax=Collibacillus ludicampi TaxID=2771369 RepID=A0AAV4LE07_9BACL|nr:pro-sigmaK processing inhibitor BofA family protein [Collibacillus ludicampi]GIM46006.1 pro-sigmaK processing inhibitor BofA [Collibacillus ludicampi]